MDNQLILFLLFGCWHDIWGYVTFKPIFILVIMSTNNARIGWVVEYLVRVRHGNLANIGYVPAGSYGGLFLGRLLLAEPTHRFGERLMLSAYAFICLVLQLVFWLVPNLISSIVVFSVMGFFLGPFFAAVSHHSQSNSLV
jgi:fucose permease